MSLRSLEISGGAEQTGLYHSRDEHGDHWKLPMVLAVGAHLVAFLITMLGPSLFYRRPSLPEIYTVSLFNAAEVMPPQAKTPKKTPQPQKAEKRAAKSPVPAKTESPIQREVISLRPLRTKKKIVKDKHAEKTKDLKLSQALKRIEAKVTQKENIKATQQKAEEEARKALSALRQSLQSNASKKTTAAAGYATSAGGTVSDMPEVLKRYYASVILHVQQFWSLPDTKNWEKSLEALVVIQVRRDGIVEKNFFEKESDNFYFNKFVEKAVQQASPLPKFPQELVENRIEIGLRFRPGELF